MPTLINMEMSQAEAKEYTEPKPSDAPKYPWGLCISLNDDSLDKLGIEKLPAVETEVTIVAKAVVTRTSENQNQGGEPCMSLDLQITDMQLGGLDVDTASKLYDKTK